MREVPPQLTFCRDTGQTHCLCCHGTRLPETDSFKHPSNRAFEDQLASYHTPWTLPQKLADAMTLCIGFHTNTWAIHIMLKRISCNNITIIYIGHKKDCAGRTQY